MVTLYSTGCPVCLGVKNYLNMNKIQHVVVENYEEVVKIAEEHNFSHLPISEFNGEWFEGKDIINALKNNI